MTFLDTTYSNTFYCTNSSTKEFLPIIFLHGGPGACHNFLLPIQDSFSDREFILYDQIGSGKSSIKIDIED